MDVKPLNLSIVVGGLNESDITESQTSKNYSSRSMSPIRSRIPLVTSSTAVNLTNKHHSHCGTSFRHWPEPPPAPTKCRAQDKKNVSKHRSGSADSRFRRTLNTPNPEEEIPPPAEEIEKNNSNKHNFTSNSCELTERMPKQETLNSGLRPGSAGSKRSPHYEKISLDPLESITRYKSYDDCSENALKKYEYIEIKSIENMEKNESNKKSPRKMKSKPEEKKCQTKREPKCTSQTSNSSQTEVTFSGTKFYCSRFSSLDDPSYTSIQNEKLSDIDISNAELKKMLILNSLCYKDQENTADSVETRSVGNMANVILDPATQKIKRSVSTGVQTRSIFRDLVAKKQFWKYVEMWVTIGSFLLVMVCAWIFLVPFLYEKLVEFYYTWISPKPSYMTGGILGETINNLFNSISDILTTPSYKRIRWLNFD